MKKKTLMYILGAFLFFGLLGNAQATPIDPTGLTPVFSSPQTALPYMESDFWTTQGAIYIGGTADLYNAYPSYGPSDAGNDDFKAVSEVLYLYNSSLSITDVENYDGVLSGVYSGSVYTGEFEYISLKWDGVFGLWDVRGITDPFYFSGLNWELSHYTLWNPNGVPEPATMLLLGAGLLGLAGLGRKKLFK